MLWRAKMVDIAKCPGEGCSKRNECYRHRAYPDSQWQSYMTTPEKKGEECEMFMPIEGRRVMSIMDFDLCDRKIEIGDIIHD